MKELAKRVQAVLFDLDETLLDDDRSMRQAVARTCASLNQLHPGINVKRLECTYLRVSKDTWAALNSVPRASASPPSSGAEVRLQVWRQALAFCGLSDPALAVEAASIYSRERRNSYRPFPEAPNVLRTLHTRFRLGVVTNGTGDVQREKVRVTGVEQYLDVFLVSGEVGIGKPDPQIFMKALDSLALAPEEALYVGDSLVFDVGGAKNAGMYAAWINRARHPRPPGAPVPDVELSSLEELLPFLIPTGHAPHA